MQIDWFYRDAVPVGTSATSLLLAGATLLDNVLGPPSPAGHPLIHHFGLAGLCRAQIKHIDQFQYSESTTWPPLPRCRRYACGWTIEKMLKHIADCL